MPEPRSRYKQNRLQQLRGFYYAARTKSISKAAARMQLSQPSVSLQIKALEQELGTQLFERRGPRIELTHDGQRLLELARPLVEGIDGLAPIGVLGAAPLSAAPIKKEGVARAFLMDVRNGYPYGAASASVDLASLDRPFWDERPEDALGIEAKIRITRGLAPEVERMVGGLVEAMAARKQPAS